MATSNIYSISLVDRDRGEDREGGRVALVMKYFWEQINSKAKFRPTRPGAYSDSARLTSDGVIQSSIGVLISAAARLHVLLFATSRSSASVSRITLSPLSPALQIRLSRFTLGFCYRRSRPVPREAFSTISRA